MSEPSVPKFGLVNLFTDPPPHAIINGRIMLTMLNLMQATTLTEEEKERFLRILTMVARKMATVWNHKQRFVAEQERLVAEIPTLVLNPNLSSNIMLSQELFCEFDEFLVQLKSTLDYLVKIPVPIFGKKVWNLQTFGGKGDDVLNVLRHNLPEKYKQSAKTFELLVLDQHRPWLDQVIKMRDKVNHHLEEGLQPQAFAVFKQSDQIRIPMYTKEQSVAQLIEMVWQNFLGFIEDFVALSLSFKSRDELCFMRMQRPAPDDPNSPWRITTVAQKDEMISKPGWTKV